MEELVRFRMLSDELNDNEFNQFIAETIRLQGRELITKSFFTHFKDTQQSITPLINIQSQIITSREIKEDESISSLSSSPSSYDCIDELPSELIAETASFLWERTYFLFSQCNRKIYTSLYSPCKLYIFGPQTFIKYPQCMKMDKFKSVKKLYINIAQFNRISLENRRIWNKNQLKLLDIDSTNGAGFDGNIFIKAKTINFDGIQQIRLQNFGSRHHTYNASVFSNLITNFSSVHRLYLRNIHLMNNPQPNGDDIIKYLPNLKQFICRENVNPKLTQTIVHSLGHQLEALYLSNITNLNISKKGFPNLEELSLFYPALDVLDIFKYIKLLKRARLYACSHQIIKIFIERIIYDQPALQCLCIEANLSYLQFIMETIKLTLKNIKRDSLIIVIDTNFWNGGSSKIKDVHFVILGLMDVLYKSEMNNFSVRISMQATTSIDKDSNEMEEIMNEFNAMNQRYLIRYRLEDTLFFFSISNKNSKIADQYLPIWTD